MDQNLNTPNRKTPKQNEHPQGKQIHPLFGRENQSRGPRAEFLWLLELQHNGARLPNQINSGCWDALAWRSWPRTHESQQLGPASTVWLEDADHRPEGTHPFCHPLQKARWEELGSWSKRRQCCFSQPPVTEGNKGLMWLCQLEVQRDPKISSSLIACPCTLQCSLWAEASSERWDYLERCYWASG